MSKFRWLAAAVGAFIITLIGSLIIFSSTTHYVPLGMSARVAVVDYEIHEYYDGIEIAVRISESAAEYRNVVKIELFDNINYAKIYYKNIDKIEIVWVKDPYNRLYIEYSMSSVRNNVWEYYYKDINGMDVLWIG